jgi:rhodanese-related sulfurtransferase
MKKSIAQAVILLVTASALALIGNAISSRGLPLRTPPPKSAGQPELISLEDAKKLWSNGSAFFLDAREPGQYAAGHVPGAFNLPALRFERHFDEVAPVLSLESEIVVYCDGIECDLSHRVGGRLKELGFTKVRILSNGWSVWRQAGLPSSSAAQASTIEDDK